MIYHLINSDSFCGTRFSLKKKEKGSFDHKNFSVDIFQIFDSQEGAIHKKIFSTRRNNLEMVFFPTQIASNML